MRPSRARSSSVPAALLLLVCPAGLLAQTADEPAAVHAKELFVSELASQNYQTAAVLFRASIAGENPLRGEDAARALAELSVDELRSFAAAIRQPSGPRTLVRALEARAAGEWEQQAALMTELLGEGRLARFVAELGAQDALRIARAGDPRGLSFLAAVQERYAEAAWPVAQLALAARLLGRYEEAITLYERAMSLGGRRSEFLNGLAKVHCAKDEIRLAERCLREACTTDADRRAQGDAFENLAILLLKKARRAGAEHPKDVDAWRHEALGLLRAACVRDPSRLRASYWLARLLREGV